MKIFRLAYRKCPVDTLMLAWVIDHPMQTVFRLVWYTVIYCYISQRIRALSFTYSPQTIMHMHVMGMVYVASCPIHSNPNNAMTCCVFNGYDGDSITGDTCHYKCNAGHDLIVSNSRTCQSRVAT